MVEKLSIEISKHSDEDVRVVIKTSFRTLRSKGNDLCKCQALVSGAIEGFLSKKHAIRFPRIVCHEMFNP